MQAVGCQVQVISGTEIESFGCMLKLKPRAALQHKTPFVGALIQPVFLWAGVVIGMDEVKVPAPSAMETGMLVGAGNSG